MEIFFEAVTDEDDASGDERDEREVCCLERGEVARRCEHVEVAWVHARVLREIIHHGLRGADVVVHQRHARLGALSAHYTHAGETQPRGLDDLARGILFLQLKRNELTVDRHQRAGLHALRGMQGLERLLVLRLEVAPGVQTQGFCVEKVGDSALSHVRHLLQLASDDHLFAHGVRVHARVRQHTGELPHVLKVHRLAGTGLGEHKIVEDVPALTVVRARGGGLARLGQLRRRHVLRQR